MNKKLLVGPSIINLSKLFKKSLHETMFRAGLDPEVIDYGWIIDYLYKNQNQDIFQKDLESRFHFSRSSITGIVQCLETNGYIKRTQVPYDARLKKIELTDSAIAFQVKASESIAELEKQASKNISKEDFETFQKVLEQIQSNLTEIINQK